MNDRIIPDEAAEYLWGAEFLGRGPFVIWHDSYYEAVEDAESVEDKHAPSRIVRLPLAGIEKGEKFFYGSRINNAERRWHTREEAKRDGALDE